jgi:hypothetical protein
MFQTTAYSAIDSTSPLASTTIPRRDPTDHDVKYRFEIDMASLKSYRSRRILRTNDVRKCDDPLA